MAKYLNEIGLTYLWGKIKDKLALHTSDTDVHTTADEKAVWNEGIRAWSEAAMLPASFTWSSIAYGNGKFVVLSRNGMTAYSEDGITWTQSVSHSKQKWRGIAYGDGKFVAVSVEGVVTYSANGVDWIEITPLGEYNWNDIIYGDGKFVATCYNGDVAAYSEDGIIWTQTALPSKRDWCDIDYGNGKFVVIDADNSSIAAYSEDGITWVQIDLPSKQRWSGIAYGNGEFVAISRGNVAVHSADGVVWEQFTLPVSGNWNNIIYGDGKFVAIAYGDDIAVYSLWDNTHWEKTPFPSNAGYSKIAYGNGKFVAISSSTEVVCSEDGQNWCDLRTVDGTTVTNDVETILGLKSELVNARLLSEGIVAFAIASESSVALTAYSASVPNINAPIPGASFTMIPDTTSIAKATLNVNDTRAVPVVRTIYNGTGTYPPELRANKPVRVMYDGSNWVVDNPVPHASDLVGTLNEAQLTNALPKLTVVSLPSSGWNSTTKTQTITVSGVSANETAQLIHPVPALAHQSAYIDAGILCTGQAENSLTFTAKTIPTEDLTVYITIQAVTTV